MGEQTTKSIGRYQLLAKIATGGMAEIWLARQTGIGGFEKIVVVKRILPHLATEKAFVEMFLDEAVIAAQLNHPNVVQIYDLGQADDDYFIAMEYLEGESLGHLVSQGVQKGKPISAALSASIMAQVCDGLHYAHTFEDDEGNPLGIVHRDISPHNIIIMFSGVAKIVDFGIAKAATKMHQTQVGTLKGKLAYMAPEQCMGHKVDARSDIFALGIVLWELLARKRLFKRDAEPMIIRAIMDEPIPKVRDVRESVPEAYAAVADQALQKEPEERFQSAAAMGAALRSALQMENADSSVRAIARYVHDVFGDHARTKKRILKEIREKGSASVAVRNLKPKSDSMPSHSSRSQVAGKASEEDLSAPTVIRASEEDEAEAEAAKPVEAPKIPQPGESKGPSPSVEIAKQYDDSVAEVTGAGISPKAKSKALYIVIPLLLLALGAGAYFFLQKNGGGGANKLGPEPMVPSVGTDTKPDTGKDTKPDTGKDTKQDTGKGTKPDTGKDTKQDTGKDTKHDTGKDAKQNTGKDVKLAMNKKPVLLSVSSNPSGCKVKVDGVSKRGVTPLGRLEVAAGKRHSVTVLCKGYKKQVKRAEGRGGQKVRLAFAPEKISIRHDVVTKPKGKGKLKFNSTPWTEVYLGKKRLGMTPLRGVELPAGRQKLTLVNKGRNIKKTIFIDIKPNQTTVKLIKLD